MKLALTLSESVTINHSGHLSWLQILHKNVPEGRLEDIFLTALATDSN